MEPPDNHFHRWSCPHFMYQWNVNDVPPDIWDKICYKLDIRTMSGPGVYKLANALSFNMKFRWMLEDYEKKNPDKSVTMMFLRHCSKKNISVGHIQEGLDRIDSQAAEIIPRNLQFIKDFQRMENGWRSFNNVPQQNTESISSTSLPYHPLPMLFGRRPDGSPHDQPSHQPWPHRHEYIGVSPRTCYPYSRKRTDIKQEREGSCQHEKCHFRGRMHCDSPDTLQTYISDYSHNPYTDCRQASLLQSPSGDDSLVEIPVCQCSQNSDSGSQLSCDNTYLKGFPLVDPGDLSLAHGVNKSCSETSYKSNLSNYSDVSEQITTTPYGEAPNASTAMTVPPVSGYVVSPLPDGLLSNQNANFLANEGQTTRYIHPLTRNDNNALNEIYQPTYPVVKQNQAAIGEGYQAENTLFISNQTSDDDSLTDSTERNRDRAVGISSSRRHKVKAVSSMRVFVTGGSCADEMKRIKLDLRWIEQLGVSVDWDDGDILEVGTGKWIKIFNSANLVLIGVTKSYVTNVKNRDWLPRAAKINEVVQNERLHFEGNNKRFMNIVFTQTGLKKSELRSELKFAIYCFPGSKGELETSLRKKLR